MAREPLTSTASSRRPCFSCVGYLWRRSRLTYPAEAIKVEAAGVEFEIRAIGNLLMARDFWANPFNR
jgi:hypothetical protein